MAGLQIQLPRELRAVRRAAAQFRALLISEQLPVKDCCDCELAFVEACNNAIQHSGPFSNAPILIQVLVAAETVEIRIHDHGLGFDLSKPALLPSPEAESGRGLFLIQSVMDQVQWEPTPTGPVLLLRKRRDRPTAGSNST